MTTDAESNAMVPLFADLLKADEVAEAGVLAICAQLIKKGIFADEDLTFVLEHMRARLSEREGDISAPRTRQRLAEEETALRKVKRRAEITTPPRPHS